jgi:DNA polymerase-3 subunit epsilon
MDVMILATPYLAKQRANMEDFKLVTVAKQLGIHVDDKQLHDAAYDIALTKAIFNIVSAQ